MRHQLVSFCLSLTALLGLPLHGQNYQTAFDAIEFDRKTAKHVLHGGPNVDPATGAIEMALPLGPGIGARGAVFQPTLDLRIGSGESGGALHPGLCDLSANGFISMRGFRVMGGPKGSPDGFGGLQPDLTKILTAFGFNPQGAVFLGLGSGGELRISLLGPNGEPNLNFPSWIGYNNMPQPVSECLSYPRRILIVSANGDVAYEFGFGNARYPKSPIWATDCSTSPELLHPTYLASSELTLPSSGSKSGEELCLPPRGDENFGENELIGIRYILDGIHNRHGDSIRFSWASNGVGWKAAWHSRGVSTGISVELILEEYHQPNYTGTACPGWGRTRLHYTGVDQGDVVLTGDRSGNGMVLGPNYYSSWGEFLEAFRPTLIKFEGDGEELKFTYDTSWVGRKQKNTLTSLTTSTRAFTFEWEAFSFPTNVNLSGWRGFRVSKLPELASAGWGVTAVRVKDPQEPGSERTTTYRRTIPALDYPSTVVGDNGIGFVPAWITTDFHCAVEFPDGSVTLNKYVPPLNNSDGGPDKGPGAQFQTLAHLRHLLWEERKYVAGQDWVSDLNTPAESSSAYEVTRNGGASFEGITVLDGNGQWSAKWLGNRNATSFGGPTLYPLRKETWRREAKNGGQVVVYTIDQTKDSNPSTDWNPEGPGWKTKTRTMRVDGAERFTTTQTTEFASDWNYWFPGRSGSTTSKVTVDSLEGRDPYAPLPPEETQKTTFKTATNLVDTQRRTVGAATGAAYLEASYPTYEHGLPKSVTLTGASGAASLNLSGSVGIELFDYDPRGYLSLIQPKGVTWNVQQSQDGLGRPQSQTDASGARVTSYAYDTAGRLTSIAPPGETATVISYPDLRTAIVTRGTQKTELIYNGFGDLVLERRWKEGVASHRRWGFDSSGRKRWETVWAASEGSPSGWSSPDSPLDLTKGAWGQGDCTKWLKNRVSGEYECVAYEKVWIPSTTKIPAHRWAYDLRGRLQSEVDANGVSRSYAYDGLDKIITDAVGSTRFKYDATGRLHEILDALNQKTEYRYDAKSRVTRVTQYNKAMGAQVRTWSYHPLGWVQALGQPESGTTTYSQFDVNGKPWTTNYNGREVASTFDELGHVKSVKSVKNGADADSSVDQSFVWGNALDRFASKLKSATANGVVRSLDYHSATGRLHSLTHTLDGLAPFVQMFSYDTYGRLSSRTYPDGKIQTIHSQNDTDLPDYTDWNGARLANLHYENVAWNLDLLAYVGAVSAASSTFSYGSDQTRLATVSHAITGKMTTKTWTYGFDGAGRLIADGEDSYSYDALGRLKTAAVVDPWGTKGLFQTFDYDAFGNRIQAKTETVENWTPPAALPKTLSPSPTLRMGLNQVTADLAFSVNDSGLLKNQLPATTSTGAATGAIYNAQGNLTQVFPRAGAVGECLDITYDALARVSSMSFGPIATRKSESYLYNDEGLRIRVWDGSKFKYNLYNEARQLIAQYEKTPAGALTWKKDIIYVGTKEIAEYTKPLVSGVLTDKISITMCDHLGSPRFIWDGTTLTKQKFLPFGEPLTPPSDMGKVAKGFTNHEQTDPSGLIYMQARFYLPMWGRFASPDPARDQHFEETQSWNIYSYVQNNPVMLTDPTGMEIPRVIQKFINLVSLHGWRTDAERPKMPDGTVVGGKPLSQSLDQLIHEVPSIVKSADPIPTPIERRSEAVEASRRLNQKDTDERAQEAVQASSNQVKDAQQVGVQGVDFALGKIYPGGKTAADVIDAGSKALKGDKKNQEKLKEIGKDKAKAKLQEEALKRTKDLIK